MTLELQSNTSPAAVYIVATANGTQWPNVSIIRGQENPIQGWYSPKYNTKEANDAAVFSRFIDAGTTDVAWLIVPQRARALGAPAYAAAIVGSSAGAVQVRISLGVAENDNQVVTVPLC